MKVKTQEFSHTRFSKKQRVQFYRRATMADRSKATIFVNWKEKEGTNERNERITALGARCGEFLKLMSGDPPTVSPLSPPPISISPFSSTPLDSFTSFTFVAGPTVWKSQKTPLSAVFDHFSLRVPKIPFYASCFVFVCILDFVSIECGWSVGRHYLFDTIYGYSQSQPFLLISIFPDRHVFLNGFMKPMRRIKNSSKTQGGGRRLKNVAWGFN